VRDAGRVPGVDLVWESSAEVIPLPAAGRSDSDPAEFRRKFK
jgi:hypothetical protein